MSTLKQKTLKGVFWSLMDNGISQIIQFVVGIILARILTPREFGLIGMITIFLLISDTFINSGFSQALIRKKECSKNDYTTAFYFNFFASLFFYVLLFNLAHSISKFYNQPELVNIVKVLGLLPLTNAFSIVQQAVLVKRVDFKLQTKITLVSSLTSGFIAIWMAYSGFGVWSLVIKMLLNNLIRTLLLWITNKWMPTGFFSKASFREMFGFGYKLLLSGIFKTTFDNIYYLVIGKFFSVDILGYYNRADQFTKLPSLTLTKTIQRVAFPVLSEIQDDIERLKKGYTLFIKMTMYSNAAIMILVASLAEPIILTLLGPKWEQAIPFLQLLCFVQILYPIISLNMNILIVKGRSDLFLLLEVVTKILIIPIVILGIYTNIRIMIIGMIIHSIVNFLIISSYTGKLINYKVLHQFRDITSGLLIALVSGLIVFILQYYMNFSPIYKLLSLGALGTFLIITISEIVKDPAYFEIKKIVREKIKY